MVFLSHSKTSQGFSMVEILIALVLLAVGLLGLAAMTQLVIRGNDSANNLSEATDLCELRISELKDISYDDLGDALVSSPDAFFVGAQNGEIMQEVRVNSQGLTDCGYYEQEFDVAGSPCEGVATAACGGADPGPLTSGDFSSHPECWEHIREAGPYIYTYNFVICKGEDYSPSGAHPTAGDFLEVTGGTYSGEINCDVDPAQPDDRPETLACLEQDILNPGATSNEKMIKVLCTWRKRDGRCGFVNFSALRTNL